MAQLPKLTSEQYGRILSKAMQRLTTENIALIAENAELQTRLEDALNRVAELEAEREQLIDTSRGE